MTSDASWVLDLYVGCGIYPVSFIEAQEDRAIAFKNIPAPEYIAFLIWNASLNAYAF